MSNKTPLLDEVLKYKKEENLIFSMPGNKCGKVFLKDNIGKEFVEWKGNPPIVFFGILLGDNCIFILQLPMYVK